MSFRLPNQQPPLARYRNAPIAFVRDVLGELPYPKQAEFLYLAARNRLVSVVGCNSCGKDWTAARIVLWWVETRPLAKAVVTGPTQRQIDHVLWRELRLACGAAATRSPFRSAAPFPSPFMRQGRGAGPLTGRTTPSPFMGEGRGEGPLTGRLLASRYEIDAARFAIGFSTDSPYNLQGFHSPELLVVVTEAQGVRQEHMNALKRLNPALLVLTGNPLTLTGEFYDSHHGKASLYARLAISANDTPNVRFGRPDIIPGVLTPEDVEQHRLDWGEDSNNYRASVLAQFPESLGSTLIPRTAVTAAIACHAGTPAPPSATAPLDPTTPRDPITPLDASAPPGHTAPSDPTAPLYARARRSASPPPPVRAEPVEARTSRPFLGVDVARFGDDKTVFCLRRGDRVELLEAWAHQDLMRTAERVHELAGAHNPAAIFIDATGVGAGVVDRLRQVGVRNVIDVQVGAAPRNRERFLNLRAELYWGLRERFIEGRIAIPGDPELESQLLALHYDFTASGQLRIQGKSQIKADTGASPDKADALALAFHPLPSIDIWF